MKRYHNELSIIRRNHREHLRAVHGWPKKPVNCICDMQAGRFRKMDAYDCGVTMCPICHRGKWERDGGHEPTRQEELAERKQREGTADYLEQRNENQKTLQ